MLLERKEILQKFKNSTEVIEKFQMLKLKSNCASNMSTVKLGYILQSPSDLGIDFTISVSCYNKEIN